MLAVGFFGIRQTAAADLLQGMHEDPCFPRVWYFYNGTFDSFPPGCDVGVYVHAGIDGSRIDEWQAFGLIVAALRERMPEADVKGIVYAHPLDRPSEWEAVDYLVGDEL